jgi:hypothetical protein
MGSMQLASMLCVLTIMQRASGRPRARDCIATLSIMCTHSGSTSQPIFFHQHTDRKLSAQPFYFHQGTDVELCTSTLDGPSHIRAMATSDRNHPKASSLLSKSSLLGTGSSFWDCPREIRDLIYDETLVSCERQCCHIK